MSSIAILNGKVIAKNNKVAKIDSSYIYQDITPSDTTKFPLTLTGWKCVKLESTSTWTPYSSGSQLFYSEDSIIDNKIGAPTTQIYCSHLEATPTSAGSSIPRGTLRFQYSGSYSVSSHRLYLSLDTTDISTWLNSNDVYVLYPLGTSDSSTWKAVKKISTNELGYYNATANIFCPVYGMAISTVTNLISKLFKYNSNIFAKNDSPLVTPRLTTEKTISGNGLVEFNGNRYREVKGATFYGASTKSVETIQSNNSIWIHTGKNIYSGSYITKQAGTGYSQIYCRLISGVTYTISGNIEVDNSSITKCLLINGQNTSEQFGYISVGSNKHLTFTPQKNCTSIFFYAGTSYGTSSPNTGTFRNIQIELGSIATSYVPYFSGGTINLSEIKLNGINDIKDEFEAISGKLTRRVGVVDMGSLSYARVTTTANPYFRFVITGRKNGTAVLTDAFDDYGFFSSLANFGNSAEDNQIGYSTTNEYIAIRCDLYTNAESFKSAMTGAYLVYELATPTEEYITPQPIVQISGHNTLRQISGEISNTQCDIVYYGVNGGDLS